MSPQGRRGTVWREERAATTDSTVGADEPSDDAIAQLARRHALDPLTPSAATTQYLDQAIERVARSYLTAHPAELTEEVRLHTAWVQRLLDNSRAPAQHHRLYLQLGYLTSILAQLSLAQGDHDATQAHCAAAMQAADTASCGPGSSASKRCRRPTPTGTKTSSTSPTLAWRPLASSQRHRRQAGVLAGPSSCQSWQPSGRGGRPGTRPRDDEPGSPQQQEWGLFAFPEEKLASHEGQVWLKLGAPERAQKPLQRALYLLDSATGARRSPVDQAMVRLHLARSHAELGQFDQACQRAEEALALHRQRPVDHTRRRAQELARLLKPYGEAEATQKILHELTRA